MLNLGLLPITTALLLPQRSASAAYGNGLQDGSQEESVSSTSGPPQATAGVRRVEQEPRVWEGPDGRPLPFKVPEEILKFLRTAAELERNSIGEGITGGNRLLLEKDGIRMYAIFRDVKVDKRIMELADGTTAINFRDDAIFECAAFELSRLLGLYIVPPAVKRGMKGKAGTLQAWVPGTMMEKERVEKGTDPPDMWRWLMQRQVMQIFDNLIYNEDRNVGNILITKDWLLVLIDHTRAFRNYEKLMSPDSIRYCDRNLLENLKSLNLQMLQEHLGEYLRDTQIRALLKRRDLLVEHVDRLVQEHGSGDVLFSFFR
jgi:hypothetical protein